MTLGVAAATLATMATVAGVSIGATPAEGAVSDLSSVSQTRMVVPAGQAGTSAFDAASRLASPRSAQSDPAVAVKTPAGHAQLPPVRISTAAGARPSREAAGQHADKPGHRVKRDRHARRRHHHRHVRHARPYLIYDSVTPTAIPAHRNVATYATGGYAVSPAQVAGRRHVLWIDTNGSDPNAAALDVEPGDATPAGAATWAWQKLHAAANSVAIIYTMRSEWGAVQAAVNGLPRHMRSHVRYWIADPTGYPHIVPGADATQWYWGSHYDITTARPGF